MIATKNHSIFKKLGALVMAMCLTCAMAVSASAAETADVSGEYRVAFLKEGTTTASMAQDAVNGNATVSENADGSVTILIPIKPIEDYKPMGFLWAADGFIQGLTVSGGTAVLQNIVGDQVRYDSANLVITLSSMPSDGTLSGVTASLKLFYADSATEYPFVSQMDPTFDIQLTKVA